MLTTDVHASRANHKTLCQGEARASQSAKPKPPAPLSKGDGGGMHCTLLTWAASRIDLPTHLHGILIRLVSLMDEQGALTLGQAEIAARIRVSERQTRAAIKDLVASGVLTRKRRGSVRGGRQSDMLVLAFERQRDSGGASPVSVDNMHSGEQSPVSPVSVDKVDSGGASPVSSRPADNGDMPPVSKKLAHIENARAPAETPNNINSLSEIYPEREELASAAVAGARDAQQPPKVLNGHAKQMAAHELAAVLVERVNSPWLDPNKSLKLTTSVGRIHAWMRDLGADFDLDILPTITAVMARRASKTPVSAWGYFDNAIREAVAHRIAADAPMSPIQPSRNTHDHASSASDRDPGVRRRPRSLLTQRAMQLMSQG